MAKKIASGDTHLVIDIPVGQTLKIRHFKDAQVIAAKFKFLADKFKIKISIDINRVLEPAGHAVGPVLEAADVLKVLEQRPDRPFVLEAKTIRLAGKLLDLCFESRGKKNQESGEDLARKILISGRALKKMQEIIKIQGGNPHVSSDSLKLAKYKFEAQTPRKGVVTNFNNHNLTIIAKILGSPKDKQAGIYLTRRIDERVDKNDILCILYSGDKWRLEEAKETLISIPIYNVQ